MLGLMKEYNRLLERYKKAEQYFADENISIEDKVKQNDNIIKLHDEIIVKAMEINVAGYIMCEHEYDEGFRQIEFLESN